MSATSEGAEAEIARTAAKIRLLDTVPKEVRSAFGVLSSLVKELPDTETFLFAPESVAAWRTLQSHDAETFMVYRENVVRRCGRITAGLLDMRIGPPRALGSANALPGFTLTDLWAGYEPPAYLVRDFLVPAGLTVLVGQSGHLKSQIALELSLAAATGGEFHGKRANRTGVLYVAGEGHSGIKLPSLPGGLISKPTLVWDIETATAGGHNTRFAYQTAGMTWWADYNITYSDAAATCRMDVGAWVTLVNQSGASYTDARLKLIAGDVQRAQPRYPAAPQPAMAARAMAKEADGFAEKAFFEYHLYTLGRTTSLPDNSTKQIELFPTAPGVGCEKNLVYVGQAGNYSGYGSPMTDRNFGLQSNRKVDVYLRFRNTKDNGMGIPLPAGKIRVSKLDPADRSLEFIGEDLIDHTARDETVQIKLGSAFDVVGERRQLDFRIDTSARWIEEDIEVKVRNQKPDEAATVIVKENLYRWSNWTILKKSQDFTREDARTIHFPVKLAPKAEAVVRYTVRYTW